MNILTFKMSKGIAPELFVEDSASALKELGHSVDFIDISGNKQLSVGQLREEIITKKPDFVFTVDHAGLIPELLTEARIPFASWFIDSPFYWAGHEALRRSISSYCLLFLWDRAYTKPLKEMGFKNVYYLPLATNPNVFKEIALSKEEKERFGCRISFAGASFSHALSLYEAYCRQKIRDPKIKVRLDEVIKELSQNPLLDIKNLTSGLSLEEEFVKCLDFAGSSLYRKEAVEAVAGLGLNLYGDDGWKELFKGQSFFKGPIENRTDLPKLYNGSLINLNITKSQLRTALNMRLFDIAACGGFILTDWREDLERLFKVGNEVAVYRNKGELREKAAYYLTHPQEREEMAKRAKKKVLERHTFKKRMEKMIKTVESLF
ncbi:glycosyltransferase [bacterium]|nr:glycosyltransferase [bacterium]